MHSLGYKRRATAFPLSPRGVPRPIRAVENSTGGFILGVTSFGADPTGKVDSSAAIRAAINKAWSIGEASGWNFTYGPDLGGIVIDLEGGQYLLESPVQWPGRPGGNLVVQHGSLHAGASFPAGGYLFQLDAIPPPNKTTPVDNPLALGTERGPSALRGTATGYDDITFRSVLFDGRSRAGGIKLLNALRMYFDGCYFLGYPAGAAGLWLSKAGGATYVESSWFSGFDWPSPECASSLEDAGVAMLVGYPDSMASDVIVACSAGGMVVRSGAWIARSVHVFGVLNKDGMGYLSLEKGVEARLESPYVDFARIFTTPSSPLTMTDGFFLGCPAPHQVPTEHTHPFIQVNVSADGPSPDVVIKGLSVTGSQFNGRSCDQGQPVPVEAVAFPPGTSLRLQNTVIEDCTFSGTRAAATRITVANYTRIPRDTFTFDLSGITAFPAATGLGKSAFASLLYSVKTSAGGFVRSVIDSEDTVNTTVVVRLDDPIQGSVSLSVDQSEYPFG